MSHFFFLPLFKQLFCFIFTLSKIQQYIVFREFCIAIEHVFSHLKNEVQESGKSSSSKIFWWLMSRIITWNIPVPDDSLDCLGMD